MENQIRFKKIIDRIKTALGIKGDMAKIICAAIRHKEKGTVICGVRHFDEIMSKMVSLVDERKGTMWEQGFVDSYGVYYDRKEALIKAREALQPLRYEDAEWFKDELYSENLY